MFNMTLPIFNWEGNHINTIQFTTLVSLIDHSHQPPTEQTTKKQPHIEHHQHPSVPQSNGSGTNQHYTSQNTKFLTARSNNKTKNPQYMVNTSLDGLPFPWEAPLSVLATTSISSTKTLALTDHDSSKETNQNQPKNTISKFLSPCLGWEEYFAHVGGRHRRLRQSNIPSHMYLVLNSRRIPANRGTE